jgi:AcrR family transcriptional regulator
MTKKEEIIEKAMALFCERGYDNTPMSHIAKAIDASKAILYHYFPNKEELLFSIIHHQMEKHLTPILEEASAIKAPDERLRFFLKNYTRLLAGDSNARIVLHEAHRLSPEHLKIIRTRHQIVYRIIYDAIAEMELLGKIAAPEKAFYTFAAIGMCTWTFYWFDQDRKETIDRLADTFTDLFFNGILNAKGLEE